MKNRLLTLKTIVITLALLTISCNSKVHNETLTEENYLHEDLVIFPALSAMRIFKSFKSVTICSAIISVVCSVAGLLISIIAGTPVGSTIVAVDIAVFIISSITGKLVR